MPPPSSFGLLLVSQGALADELINTASGVLGARPADVLIACARNGDKRADIESRVRKAVDQLVAECGRVLILCDLFGSTPANVARIVSKESPQIACCCGVNLAMLLEALNFRHLPLEKAVPKILAAGRCAIVNGDNPQD